MSFSAFALSCLAVAVLGISELESGFPLALQAVGASGAIFGMVGAWTAFCIMNRAVMGRENAQRSLAAVGQTLAFNLFLGMSSSQIDNMGHVGVSE